MSCICDYVIDQTLQLINHIVNKNTSSSSPIFVTIASQRGGAGTLGSAAFPVLTIMVHFGEAGALRVVTV